MVVPSTIVEDEFGFVATTEGESSTLSDSRTPMGPAADTGAWGNSTTGSPAARQPILSDSGADLFVTPDPDLPTSPATARPQPAPPQTGPRTSGDAIARLNLELSELPSRHATHPTAPLADLPVALAGDSHPAPPDTENHPNLPVIQGEKSRKPSGGRGVARTPVSASRRWGVGQVLLLSYASAMTIACLWLVWQLRSRRAPTPPTPAPLRAVQRLDPGMNVARGPFVEPTAAPIPSDRVTRLSEPLQVGELEVVPLEIRSTSVTLEGVTPDGQRTTRDGGGGVLVLKVRLRNTSEDLTFTPLDWAFVRLSQASIPETFIEAGESRIYAYPLPVRSEWAIAGQEFRELSPGETFETVIASDEGALARTSDEMTWRLRLRTGPGEEQVDTLAVRFRRDQIR